MDPITLLLIIAVVGYASASPDRASLRTTRGSAHAVRSAWVRGTPGRARWARSGNPVLRSAWRTERAAVRGARWWRSAWSAARRARSDYRAGADRAVLDRAHAQAIREDRFRGDPDRLPAPGPVHEPDRGPCVFCGTPTAWTTAEDGTPRLECSACSETFRADFARPLTGLTYPPDQPGPAEPDRAGEPTEGAPVPDITNVSETELETTTDLRAEVIGAQMHLVQIIDAWSMFSGWVGRLPERYEAAPWGTASIDQAVEAIAELAPSIDVKVLEQVGEALAALSNALTSADRVGEVTTEQAARGPVQAFQEA